MILYLKARSDLRKTPEDREFSNWHALNRPILLRIMRSVWTDLYCATKRLTNNRCQLQELRQNIFVFPDECAKSSRCRNRERWKAFRRFSWVPKICNTFWPTLQESLPCDGGAATQESEALNPKVVAFSSDGPVLTKQDARLLEPDTRTVPWEHERSLSGRCVGKSIALVALLVWWMLL